MITALWREMLPEVELLNLLDDGVVHDAVVAGRVEPQVTRRMCNLFQSAETAGANFILLCCSTVGETADVGRSLTTIPIMRIDEPMAEQAVAAGKRIGVMATVSSTLA